MSALSSALKMIGSVAALMLAGVLAAWLWFDATAVARHDTPGVVVPADGTVAAGPAAAGPALPAERARQLQARSEALNKEVAAVAATERKLDAFGTNVRQAMDELAIAGDEAAAEKKAAAKAAKEKKAAEKKAAEKAAAEKAAAEKAAADKAAAERAARERVYTPPPAPAPAPAPVPVVPPGMCWDDDEWEECDDDEWDDDEWDDDEWDD